MDKVLYFYCFLLFSEAVADTGFLRIAANSAQDIVELCAGFNPYFRSFPPKNKHLPLSQWHQVVDAYPGEGCEDSRQNYSKKYVFLKRGNCTFAEKALHVKKAGGLGVVIVSDSGLLTPGLDPNRTDVNFTVMLISAESYNTLRNFQQKHGIDDVRVLEYAPHAGFVLDPNIMIIWCIAVFALAYGSWLQGSLHQKSILTGKTRTSKSGSSGEASVGNADQDVTGIGMNLQIVIVFLCASSVSILLLYFFYDYLVYFIIACFCLVSSFALFELIYFKVKGHHCFRIYRIFILKYRPPIFGIFLFLLCVGVSLVWFVFRKTAWAWILQDLMGFSFCIFLIKLIRLPNFKISVVLLLLFFAYDIFYVFITPLFTKNKVSVMEQIALGGQNKSKEELPLLFKVPKFVPSPTAKCDNSKDYSYLGYGDIVLPGFHVGLCAAWDIMLNTRSDRTRYTYYIAAVIGYSIGLIMAFVAVILMRTGQPALLYLVPCCLISTLLVALKRNQLRYIWSGETSEVCPNTSACGNMEESHSLIDMQRNGRNLD